MPPRLTVCSVDELPAEGEMRAFAVAGLGVPVLLSRVEGEVFATSGMCPHEDVELVDGQLGPGPKVTCPGHGYELDLRTGGCTPDRKLSLPRYQVWIDDGSVHIDLSGPPTTIGRKQ